MPLSSASRRICSAGSGRRLNSKPRRPSSEETSAYPANGGSRPTLPGGVEQRRFSELPHELLVRVTAGHHGSLVSGEHTGQLLFWGRGNDGVVERARGAVEAQERAVGAEGQLQRRPELAQVVEVFGLELLGTPAVDLDDLAPLFVPGGVGYRPQQPVVRVSHDDRASHLAQALDGLARLRACGGHVAEAQDPVGTLAGEIFQHGLQGGQVAVEVRDQSHPHECPPVGPVP
ncbi:MAG TPA: hypothetical protein VGR18_04365 [Rubrobacter sp.]|nr:hypothetical protein [Rubrobacter sp.]